MRGMSGVGSRRVSWVCAKGETPGTKEEREFQDEEEIRLQNDRGYAFREFCRISVAAVGIGLVLFFYDILVSLVVFSIGIVYAGAVLLEVRGADQVLNRIGWGVVAVWSGVVSGVREGYRAVRREVRKGLED